MEKKRFPKMVYGPGNEQVVIQGPDEMPEGYMTYKEKFQQGYTDGAADAAAGAIIAADGAASSKKAADEAQAARDAATKATEDLATAEAEKVANAQKEKDADEERMHRDRLKEFLTAHNVDFVPQSGTAKLESLSAQLREHLDAQPPAEVTTENTDDSGE